MSVTQTPEIEPNVDRAAASNELNRVLSSRSFAKSSRLCSLLRYIVTESLDGHPENLTEQQIGIQIFGRSPGYNSSDDTIVRATVRQLRQRLDLYYSSEGVDGALRIDIPKGAYVSSLVTRISPAVIEPAVTPPAISLPSAFLPTSPDAGSSTLRAYRVTVVLLLVALIALGALFLVQRHRLASVSVLSGPLPLWQALFTPDRKTLIVPGDAALDMYSIWEQQPVPLDQYASQAYQQQSGASSPPSHTDVPLATRSVTPMADLALVAALVRAPEQMGRPSAINNVEIRYARDVAIADTHDNNLILIGAESFNPWVSLYQSQLDFVAHYDLEHDVYTIENKAPKPGESKMYLYRRTKPNMKALTHIAMLSNSQGGGHVLIVEGTSMGSTYGALNFLQHASLYEPVLQQAIDASGHLRDFEVLLSGDFIHGGVGNTKVISEHIH